MSSPATEEKRGLFRPTAGDLLLAGFLAIVGIGLTIMPWTGGGELRLQVITRQGVRDYALSQGMGETIEVQGSHGLSVIRVDSRGCRFIKSQCSNGLCVEWGIIDRAGEAAVCAPNGVAIRILEGKRERVDIDGLTY